MRLDQLYPISQTIDIKDGLGEATDIKLLVVGPDSKQYRDGAKKAARLLQGKEKAENYFDLLEQANGEIFSSCIVGWVGLEDEEGILKYTPEKAAELIANPDLGFVRSQVEAALAERAKFFRKSGQAA